MFMRKNNCNIPSRDKIRKARLSFLESVPTFFILREGALSWESMQIIRFVNSVSTGCNIECTSIRLLDAMKSYLSDCKQCSSWPFPPPLHCIDESNCSRTLVSILSIDTGTGTTKLMGRFLRFNPTQDTNDVLLIGEAQGTDESFHRLVRYFGPIYDDIEHLEHSGITIGETKYEVVLFHTSDFKLLYSVTGVSSASSRFPCLYCTAKNIHMDHSKAHLCSVFQISSLDMLHANPEMMTCETKVKYVLTKKEEHLTFCT